jgi:hypothetical protein
VPQDEVTQEEPADDIKQEEPAKEVKRVGLSEQDNLFNKHRERISLTSDLIQILLAIIAGSASVILFLMQYISYIAMVALIAIFASIALALFVFSVTSRKILKIQSACIVVGLTSLSFYAVYYSYTNSPSNPAHMDKGALVDMTSPVPSPTASTTIQVAATHVTEGRTVTLIDFEDGDKSGWGVFNQTMIRPEIIKGDEKHTPYDGGMMLQYTLAMNEEEGYIITFHKPDRDMFGAWSIMVYYPQDRPSPSRIGIKPIAIRKNVSGNLPGHTLMVEPNTWTLVVFDSRPTNWRSEEVEFGLQVYANNGPFNGPIMLDHLRVAR